MALLAGLAFCQSLAPQVSVVVRKHPTGADMVEITPVKADYPVELLRRQAEAIGVNTGVPSRGVSLTRVDYGGGKPELKFLKAKFATNNLIDRESGSLRLEPIVRAFTGAPEPFTVSVIDIHFADEIPDAKQIKKLKNESVAVVGNQQILSGHKGVPTGVEYRVMLLTQDPAKISIPVHAPDLPTKTANDQTPGKRSPVLLMALIALASISAGALVYCLMLGARRQKPRSG